MGDHSVEQAMKRIARSSDSERGDAACSSDSEHCGGEEPVLPRCVPVQKSGPFDSGLMQVGVEETSADALSRHLFRVDRVIGPSTTWEKLPVSVLVYTDQISDFKS